MDNHITWWDKCFNRQGDHAEKLQIYAVTAMLRSSSAIKHVVTGNYWYRFTSPLYVSVCRQNGNGIG
jgi:hypothetical protein